MGNIAKGQEFSTPRASDDDADVEGHGLKREGFTGSTKREGFTSTKREGFAPRASDTGEDDVEGHGLKLRSPSSSGE